VLVIALGRWEKTVPRGQDIKITQLRFEHSQDMEGFPLTPTNGVQFDEKAAHEVTGIGVCLVKETNGYRWCRAF